MTQDRDGEGDDEQDDDEEEDEVEEEEEDVDNQDGTMYRPIKMVRLILKRLNATQFILGYIYS